MVNPALQFVTKVQETTDIKEVAHLLSTGEWIAISATSGEVSPIKFVLGKVS